jgi:hypothetical protein
MNMPLYIKILSWLDSQKVRPKLYLAGKIRKDCWRHKLVTGLREHHWSLGHLLQDNFTYVGPFFVGCDHGCYHQSNSHGNGIGCWPDRDTDQQEVGRLCREAVSNADLVFCFINSKDCYGTLAEIERAHVFGIRVVIAFAPGIASEQNNDMWFVCAPAYRIHYGICERDLPALLNKTIEEYSC